MDIIITNTPKKYENMVEEIVPSFLKLLKELTLLEEEIYMRNRKMDVEKTILNIPANQIHPNCLPKLRQNGAMISFQAV